MGDKTWRPSLGNDSLAQVEMARPDCQLIHRSRSVLGCRRIHSQDRREDISPRPPWKRAILLASQWLATGHCQRGRWLEDIIS